MGRTRGNNAQQQPCERLHMKTNPSGKGALFHCNNCNKDITDVVRIKCHTCTDFDLCVECFSVGAEVWPHKRDHPYRVLNNKNLSVPIISPDWSAEQEMLLVEGLHMFGPSNWAEVAEHVATKSEQECAEHYRTYYLSTPNLVPVTKNVDEILAMAKEKERNSTGKGPELSRLNDSGGSSGVKDQALKNSCEKDLDPSSTDLNGYNPKTHQFDVEYDNDAEKLLVDLEFNDNDTELERELKLRVVRIYNKRVEERNRRKDFIIERGLLHPNPIEKDFTPEEKELCRKFDPFMRFHSKEEHNELLKIVVEEHRILTRIKDLEEARAAGFHTLAKANKYIEIKRRLIAEDKTRLAHQATGASNGGGSGSSNKSSSMSGQNMSDPPLNPSRPVSMVDLLSRAEKQLCSEMGYSAELYMKLQDVMARLIFKEKITKKSDTYAVFARFERSKLDMVYDMLVKKGIAPPS